MPTAIYHLEAKVISRGIGRSVVAAAAYMSCSRITNDYDGITHDYTRKQGLVFEQVFLPDHAPREWQDRSVLWNAVEQAEKTKDSRLAREFVVALPIEFDLDLWTDEVTRFARKLTDDGMCVDVCIHDTDGHNPHAHIMATVRPLNKNGSWQRKTEKEYLCRRGYEERGFTASEFKAAEVDGWEKQYLYKCGKEKRYLPPSQAEGWERISKYPKSSRYGRENPISARWNSEEQLCLWRKQWADIVNRDLEWLDEPKRIDHRSFTAQGILLQPTIHEGVKARMAKKNGALRIPDRVSVNRLIREYDPGTAVNENMLYRLIEAGKLPFDMHGSRMVVDLETVTRLLMCMLDMENGSVFPRIRSIHDAVMILKEEQPEIGIGEPQIRELIRLDRLRSIEIGNRHYIAPESFTAPYCYRLTASALPPPRRTPPYRKDAMAQFNELMAKNQHWQTMGKR